MALKLPLAITISGALIGLFAIASRPTIAPGVVPGPSPDSQDYAFAAQALLHGTYVVSWDGRERPPYYPPGLPLLLTPVVAIGGPEAAVWTSWGAALMLGCLAALVSRQFGRPIAVPLTVLFALYVAVVLFEAGVVMSDLVSANFLVVELLVLARAPGSRGWAAAGIIGACLAWIRLASAIWLLAGLFALASHHYRRRALVAYVCGAVPVLGLLGAWQWITLGSPFATGYQVLGAGPAGSSNLNSFFSLDYVFGPPAMVDSGATGGQIQTQHLPNAVAYALQFAGLDGFVLMPGVGVVGLGTLLYWLRASDARLVAARFSLAVLLLTLAVYVPYYFQGGRFLLPAASLLAIAGACGCTAIAGWLSGQPLWKIRLMLMSRLGLAKGAKRAAKLLSAQRGARSALW